MKISFSLTKAPPPKRKIQIQGSDPAIPARQEVISVSATSGVEVEKCHSEVNSTGGSDLVIPVHSLYTKIPMEDTKAKQVDHGALVKSQNKSGIIAGGKTGQPIQGDFAYLHRAEPPRKKQQGSILMQIRAAREKGLVIDAPDAPVRSLDPEKFGWALLRGMGYNGSEEEAADSSQPVVRNQGRLGLGVKLDKP
jgi:hypothetical protein